MCGQLTSTFGGGSCGDMAGAVVIQVDIGIDGGTLGIDVTVAD